MCEKLWPQVPRPGGQQGLHGRRVGQNHRPQKQPPDNRARQSAVAHTGVRAFFTDCTQWTVVSVICQAVCVFAGGQAWADAFRSSPDLTGVVHIYEELKRKGVEFPMADLDALSPIHTPQRVRGSKRKGPTGVHLQ